MYNKMRCLAMVTVRGPAPRAARRRGGVREAEAGRPGVDRRARARAPADAVDSAVTSSPPVCADALAGDLRLALLFRAGRGRRPLLRDARAVAHRTGPRWRERRGLTHYTSRGTFPGGRGRGTEQGPQPAPPSITLRDAEGAIGGGVPNARDIVSNDSMAQTGAQWMARYRELRRSGRARRCRSQP